MKKYKKLKPEFVKCCKKIMKEQPDKKKEVIKVMAAVLNQINDECNMNPPYGWDVIADSKTRLFCSNGIFDIHMTKKKGKYCLKMQSAWFLAPKKTLQLPIKRKYKTFTNEFKAFETADKWKRKVEEEYFS